MSQFENDQERADFLAWVKDGKPMQAPPPQPLVMGMEEIRKSVMRAIFDPGKTEGYKGERDLTTWQTDAVMRALADEVATAQGFETLWKNHRDELLKENTRLTRLFDQQWKRTREAGELWRQAHPGNDLVSPDLGELVTWLMSCAAPAQNVPCPCTLIEQDEDCPVGYPSLLCGICKGTGNTTSDQVTALACEMIKIASDIGGPEDPFAAWESIDLIKSQNDRMRKALAPFANASVWRHDKSDAMKEPRPKFPSDVDLMEFEGNSLTLCDLLDARAAIDPEDDNPECTDCGGAGITYQTERACSCSAGDEYRMTPVPDERGLHERYQLSLDKVVAQALSPSALPKTPRAPAQVVMGSDRTTIELKMTAFADTAPQRDEFNGEQTILTYTDRVGTWDLAFFESGEEFPERWLGDTHWIDITRMWPGVIAQIASFAASPEGDQP
ncbi:hypothetical protein [Rhizobium sp. 18055]|uniref:hypothetical protein n=1 Tax=Rhizobium sp. 18055 TaxID=2681403 RepID=UPI00135CE3F1|nr:hypothetical protein [Rhizobium sp. 18055]